MSDFYIGDLTPGTFVVNVSKEKEWGIGQVQSCINNIVTINFENVGKKTINPKEVELKIIDIKIGKTNEKLKNKISTLKRFNIDLGFIIVF